MSSKRWGTSGDVRERILDAALCSFRCKGYAATTMTDIVSEANISIGSIYHHFGGKEELFAACYLRQRALIRSLVDIEPGSGMSEPGHWEKAYLWAVWTQRENAAVFLDRNLPFTFDPVAEIAEYYRNSLGEKTSRMLAAITLEAMRLVIQCSADEASAVIDHADEMINLARQVPRASF